MYENYPLYKNMKDESNIQKSLSASFSISIFHCCLEGSVWTSCGFWCDQSTPVFGLTKTRKISLAQKRRFGLRKWCIFWRFFGFGGPCQIDRSGNIPPSFVIWRLPAQSWLDASAIPHSLEAWPTSLAWREAPKRVWWIEFICSGHLWAIFSFFQDYFCNK